LGLSCRNRRFGSSATYVVRADLTPRDIEILKTVAEYRILTTSQLTLLIFPSQQMARKKVRELKAVGLLKMAERPSDSSAGRPESLVCLTSMGLKVLKDSGEVDAGTIGDQITNLDFRSLGHQLLVNWVWIHLAQLVRQRSYLKVDILSSSIHRGRYEISLPDPRIATSIIPDGIFSITDTKQGKSLLFFLEVDMGTETLSSSDTKTTDIRKKILSYQQVFRAGSYKQFEEVPPALFRGFRTLFVANTQARSLQLCRLVRSVPATDFIWLADQHSLFKSGISARIWTKGGDTKFGLHSILGVSQSLEYQLPLNK